MAGRTHRIRVIAVTGAIGSGKTAVLDAFARAGIPTISADIIAREVVAPGTAGLRSLVETFGPEVVTDAGMLDRRRLAERVFGDDCERRRLNAITHPLIRARMNELIQEYQDQGAMVVVLEIPLLEAKTVQDYGIDDVLVVSTPPALALERLINNRGMDPNDATARMAVQIPDEERERLGRWIIVNDGSRDALVAQVGKIIEEVKNP
ncbi:dephospho-CoA kinase [Ferrimicrobium sp.]|uniref:dephospho-CoA kinase n=1 Tax=Ferrimicrobium sp. TaxID=2926050 RepID=UPI002606BE87|nr:dephospho-CoA kinase [Ferrimicrobium sp.]